MQVYPFVVNRFADHGGFDVLTTGRKRCFSGTGARFIDEPKFYVSYLSVALLVPTSFAHPQTTMQGSLDRAPCRLGLRAEYAQRWNIP